MEKLWCGKTQISIHPQKVQHQDQYLSNEVTGQTRFVSRTLELFQSAGFLAKCMYKVAQKKITYVQSGHYLAQSSGIVFHS